MNHSRDGLLERQLAGEVRAGRAHTAGRQEPAAVAAAARAAPPRMPRGLSEAARRASSATSTSAPLPLLTISSPVEPPAARAVHVVDLGVKCSPQKVTTPAKSAGRALHRTAGNSVWKLLDELVEALCERSGHLQARELQGCRLLGRLGRGHRWLGPKGLTWQHERCQRAALRAQSSTITVAGPAKNARRGWCVQSRPTIKKPSC